MEWVVSFMTRSLWPRKKETPVNIPWLGDSVGPTPVRALWRKYRYFYLPGIELRFLGCPTRNLSCARRLLAPCVFAKTFGSWSHPPAPRFITPHHFWWVGVSSVRCPTAQACPLATSNVTSTAATNFPFIISETRSLIIRQRLICAVMRHLLSSACELLKACVRLRYGKEQNRPNLVFQAATTSFWRISVLHAAQSFLPSEADTWSPRLVKKFPTVSTTRRFFSVFPWAFPLPLSKARCVQFLPYCFFKNLFNITLPFVAGSSRWSLSFQFHYQNPWMHLLRS